MHPSCLIQTNNHTTYTYDAAGNHLGLTTGGDVVKYIYDAADRSVGVSGGGINAAYTYKGNGLRVHKQVRRT